jgi:hypothetical protein
MNMTTAQPTYIQRPSGATQTDRLHILAADVGTQLPDTATTAGEAGVPASKQARLTPENPSNETADGAAFRLLNAPNAPSGPPQWDSDWGAALPPSLDDLEIPGCPPSWLDDTANWPDFVLLCGTARGSSPAKFRQALGSLACSASVAFSAALRLIEGMNRDCFHPKSFTAKSLCYYNIFARGGCWLGPG